LTELDNKNRKKVILKYLSMEKQNKFYLSIGGVGLATGILLMVPLIAMQFTDEVNWSVADFMLMGALLFGTGTLMVFTLRLSDNLVFKAASILVVGSFFLMIWANLAVGLIGSGPNAGNLLYIVVLGVAAVGLYLSRFTAGGLERTMFATAIALIVLAAVALLSGMQHYPGSSVIEIIGVNLFFATPLTISGFLYRFVALQQHVTRQS